MRFGVMENGRGMKREILRRITGLALVLALVFQFTSCGTLIYPERRGQTGGRIDPGIAILDGIGLLFFIVPGLVAYAIDFSTGAIYLPGTASVTPEAGGEDGGMVVVQTSPGGPTEAELEAILEMRTGRDVDLAAEAIALSTVELADASEVGERYAALVGTGVIPGR